MSDNDPSKTAPDSAAANVPAEPSMPFYGTSSLFQYIEPPPRVTDSHSVAVNALLEIALNANIEPSVRVKAAEAVIDAHAVPTELLPVLANKAKVSE